MSSRGHSYFQDLLEQQISGVSLAPADRLSLFDHIETCDACRIILEAEERLTARMKTVPKLVAPSDLRSKILSQAIRDHRERTTAPSEDPALVDVLAPDKLIADEKKSDGEFKGEAGAASEDMPVFAGIAKPGITRGQRIWRRASPVLATSFLAVASVGALYTGQFQGIPLAGQAQQVVWSVVDSFAGQEGERNFDGEAVDFSGAMANVIVGFDEPETDLEQPEPAMVSAGPLEPETLKGTELLVSGIQDARALLASVDSAVARIAEAAKAPVPGPAEEALPQIAALVLKPTNSRVNRGGFERSELAEALESLAVSQPGARLASQDQFATNGQRYRLYTLELPAGSTHRLMQTLTPYQAPEDGQIVNVLASQDPVKLGRDQKVRFFASDNARLCHALENLTPVVDGSRQEQIRVVVVE